MAQEEQQHEQQQAASARPSTSSVLWAEWRRGLKDLQNAILDPSYGIVQTHEEAGSIGNPTQAIVTNEIGTVHGGLQSKFDDYVARTPQRNEPEQAMER